MTGYDTEYLKGAVNHLECLGDKYQQATIISLITKYNNETVKTLF